MKTSSLALLIGSAVAVIGGGTALGITYAKFQKAQKDIKGSTTIGDMLAAKPEPPTLAVVQTESEEEVTENVESDDSQNEDD